MKGRRPFLIPMIVSLILLVGFLGYFLKTEYDKEKEAIILESKDKSFNRFFAALDTISTGDSRHPLVFLKKDSVGKGLNYEFKLESFTDSQSVNEIFESDQDVRIEVFDFPEAEHHDSFHSMTQRSSLVAKTTVFSDAKVLTEDVNGLAKWPTKVSGTTSGQNRFENLIILEKEVHVSFWKIMQRLIPQLLFSILLLLSIGLAYWYTTRSLIKERELAVLRNSFMSNMSHELKTPVSTIGVALEALSSFNAADNAELRKEYIDISRNEVERLGLLVDKALNISLYEQGKFVYDIQRVDLRNEIERILKTLRVQLDNDQATLTYRIKGNDFLVNVDKTHIVNVIYNLIENGVKYSPQGAEIDIEAEDRGHSVMISISDKGQGIAPQHQERVFEKFYRVPQGNTHNVKGHGLGLSYVKEVVESMGGRISLKSGMNAGSTFIIEIPKSND